MLQEEKWECVHWQIERQREDLIKGLKHTLLSPINEMQGTGTAELPLVMNIPTIEMVFANANSVLIAPFQALGQG